MALRLRVEHASLTPSAPLRAVLGLRLRSAIMTAKCDSLSLPGTSRLVHALLNGIAAVAGLLLIRVAFAYVPSLTFEFLVNRLTTFTLVATALVLLVLGYTLGRRIDELRRLSATDPLTGLPNGGRSTHGSATSGCWLAATIRRSRYCSLTWMV
jgi:hypothetical protein